MSKKTKQPVPVKTLPVTINAANSAKIRELGLSKSTEHKFATHLANYGVEAAMNSGEGDLNAEFVYFAKETGL